MYDIKHLQKPFDSTFGRFPRSMQQAFKGADYGAAIEVPYTKKKMLTACFEAIPKVIWGVSLVVMLGVIVVGVIG